jgi:hypothetical protein
LVDLVMGSSSYANLRIWIGRPIPCCLGWSLVSVRIGLQIL